MQISKGQDESIWTNEWEQLTPESEIHMWDFYGLRQWIAKFIPRHGKVVEAGCGLGRYVFYFSQMGIDIDGVDFSQSTIDYLNDWKLKNNFDVVFKKGNILDLDYRDNSLSGYISLGVIEHFIEGPQKALDEAYRVLRPGGVAIITTPSISFHIFFQKFKKYIKNSAKKILMRKNEKSFFQYWFRPGKLKGFVEKSGLEVSVCKSADLLFAFCELGDYSEKYINENSFGYKFSNKNETSCLRFLGSQSLTISVKTAEVMHCFICGNLNAKKASLKDYYVPVCTGCMSKPKSKYYLKTRKTTYSCRYIINPPLKKVEKCICDFCHKEYLSDELFEDYGFSKNVCKDCLKIPDVNIILANEYVKPVWRKRIINYKN
jgi:ubiquinone/menaquinone biosynthesis C-methylase UbiE